MIDEYLHREYAEEDDPYYERRLGEYHSSSRGGCVRKNYFNWVDDVTPDSGAWPHFEVGGKIEEIALDVLRSRHGERYVVNDIPILLEYDDFTIVGETDPVVIDDNLDVRHLYEVKSTGNLSYVYEEPKKAHVYQLHCYMLGLDQLEATLWYINKFNLNEVIHHIEFDPDVMIDIVQRTRQLHNALESEVPPPPMEDPDDWDHFCQHGDKCCKNL